MPPSGVTDGPFVKFEGWDVSGNDLAHYPDLKNNVEKLKSVLLNEPSSLYYAFNTNGWIKSWTVLDSSNFERSPGSTLYVRVQYPGWQFIQGQDSPGNDILQVTDVSVANALMNRIDEIWEDDEENENVAAFNTNGWVKRKVVFPLVGFQEPELTSLHGIYIRTEFRTFNFFPLRDSPGGDIEQDKNAIDDTPALIRSTRDKANGAGFNTNGWIKNQLDIPPTVAAFKSPWQGVYARVCWPDFVYLPGLDSPQNDLKRLTGKQLWELVSAARLNPQVVAFNTNGWLKTDVAEMPSDLGDSTGELGGLYVKRVQASSPRGQQATAVSDRSGESAAEFAVRIALFAMKGTAIVWGKWFISDASVRNEYNLGVKAGSIEILKKVRAGTLTPEVAAQDAFDMRSNWLKQMRRKSSPGGLLVAQALKPTGGTYQKYMDKYANKEYGKDFALLTREQAAVVANKTIEGAGRANPTVTKVMNGLGKFGKGLMVVGAVMSVYSVAVADEWKYELGKQVASWSGAIAGGYIGTGVGMCFGPIGAIAGGIAGGIIGGLPTEGAYSALANWFFGGSSGDSAEDLLEPILNKVRDHVLGRLRRSGKKFYVHQVLAHHMSEIRVNPSKAAKLIADTPSVGQRDSEVLATVVWLMIDGKALPTNAGNPGDLITLMDWAIGNLPQWERLDSNSDTIEIAAGQDYVYQRHTNGQIWLYNESEWVQIDSNRDAVEIAAGNRVLYKRQSNGQLQRYKNGEWVSLDKNSDTVQIAAGGDEIYQRHTNGGIWQYKNGKWVDIDHNGDTVSITASNDGTLYQLHSGGQIWVYSNGEWAMLDNNSDTVEIAASDGNLYQRHNGGNIYHYTGSGWEEIDRNGDTLGIAAGGQNLFQRHQNQIWRYLGSPYSWEQVDTTGANIVDIVTDGNTLYQRHDDGSIWRVFF
ncbi:hypothetical protein TWF718_005305 [Orbilia javanica]|uniref:Uncharacterized protein n=1 Tax=Orbilia javanica TaxID=47235 RepID=A0AAN8MPR3_9PEZI